MAIRTSHLPAPGDPITLVRRRLLRHTGINVGATMIKMGLKRCSPRVRGTDMARNSGITLSAHQKQMASWGRSTPVMLLARIQVMSGCIDQNSRLPASPTQLSKLLNQACFITRLMRIQMILRLSCGQGTQQTTKHFAPAI